MPLPKALPRHVRQRTCSWPSREAAIRRAGLPRAWLTRCGRDMPSVGVGRFCVTPFEPRQRSSSRTQRKRLVLRNRQPSRSPNRVRSLGLFRRFKVCLQRRRVTAIVMTHWKGQRWELRIKSDSTTSVELAHATSKIERQRVGGQTWTGQTSATWWFPVMRTHSTRRSPTCSSDVSQRSRRDRTSTAIAPALATQERSEITSSLIHTSPIGGTIGTVSRLPDETIRHFPMQLVVVDHDAARCGWRRAVQRGCAVGFG